MKYVKKGQAALEFLMTYGWAILVVLVAIGALAYFGVLNPSKYTANSAVSSVAAVAVQGNPQITTSTIAITLQNGAGYALTNLDVTNVPATICTSDVSGTSYVNAGAGNLGATAVNTTTFNVTDGSAATIFIAGCTLPSSNRVKGDIALTYTNPNSNMQENFIVTLTGKI